MKNIIIFLAMVVAFVSLGVAQEKKSEDFKKEPAKMKSANSESKNGYTMLHAIYLVGKRIKSRRQLARTDYSKYDFIYLIAGPKWEAKDFESSADDVMKKLVLDHSYPDGASGSALVSELIAHAHKNNVKVLISLPGTEQFNPVARDDKKRVTFARVMAAFVEKYGYDGIEIDWERTVDLELHTKLMIELRQALEGLRQNDGQEYFLTTALTMRTGEGYTPVMAEKVCKSVDWVNIMAYDLGGGIWADTASHNTPFDKIKKLLKGWEKFPNEKLCIGLANYGFIYKGISPGEKIDGNLKEKGRYFSYTELPALLEQGWTESYDKKADVPYYFSPDKKNFVTIENALSLNKKVEWVKQEKYRGVFWWEFHYDLFPTDDNEKYDRHPLVDSIK